MRYDVALAACKSYEDAEVSAALETAVTAAGGLDWVTPGMRVALKLNLVSAMKPEEAATVHPAVVVSFPTMWSRKLGNYSWRGGDSYHSYARLRPGVDVERLNQRYDELVHTKYLSK